MKEFTFVSLLKPVIFSFRMKTHYRDWLGRIKGDIGDQY